MSNHPRHNDGTLMQLGDTVTAGTITGFQSHPAATHPDNQVLVQIDFGSWHGLGSTGLTPYVPPVTVTIELTPEDAQRLISSAGSGNNFNDVIARKVLAAIEKQ